MSAAPNSATNNRIWLAVAALAISLGGCSTEDEMAAEVPPSPYDRVVTGGIVRGEPAINNAIQWLGIPFATPPTGEQRWQPPQQVMPWPEPRTPFRAPDCAQLGDPFDPLNSADILLGSEDCLYLDVYAPADATAASALPVMMWIHGGANTYGGPGNLSATRLVPEHNIILVAIRYRLGPFGWMSHPALRTGGNAAASFGTLDQIAALHWIRDNAHSFGGNPNNVTVFGESSGGRNTVGLLLSPAASGLFHRAIVQSGAVQTTSRAEAENALDAEEPGNPNSSSELLYRLLINNGAAADREAAVNLVKKLELEAIRSLFTTVTAQKLLDAVEKDDKFFRSPNVIRDGVAIPFKEPQALIEAGEYNAMPIIMGSNAGETKRSLIAGGKLVSFDDNMRPTANDADLFERIAYYGSAGWKVAAVDEPLSAISAQQEQPVFGYRFDFDDLPKPFGIDLPLLMGASQALEASFVFGQFHDREYPDYYFDDSNQESRERLSTAMMKYWAEFARTGDPERGGGNLPIWHAWTDFAVLENLMIFDSGGEERPHMTSLRIDQTMLLDELQQDTKLKSDEQRCSAVYSMNSFRTWSDSPPAEALAKYCGG